MIPIFRGRRFLAIALSLSLAADPCAFSAADASLLAGPRPASAAALQDPAGLVLPSSIGRVSEIFQGSRSSPAVLLVQDAHSVPDAQASIRDILLHLQKVYGIRTVALEGVETRLDPLILRSFPDPGILERVLKKIHDQGELAGASAAAIWGPADADYVGLEDREIFGQGLKYYLDAKESLRKNEVRMSAREAALEAQKKTHYAPKLLAVDGLMSEFHRNERSLLEVLQELQSVKPPRAGGAIEALLLSVKRAEASPLRDGALLDYAARLNAYFASLPSGQDVRGKIRALNEALQLYRTSQKSLDELAWFLRRVSRDSPLAAEFPEKYEDGHEVTQKLRDIEGSALLREYDAYAADVKRSLFKKAIERKIDQESRELELVSKWLKLELTHEDWQKVRGRRRELEQGLTPGALDSADRFYKNAQQRDIIMMRRIGKILSSRRAALPVVAGGFHTLSLSSMLRRKGVPYAVITPVIGQIPETNSYDEQMRGQVSWKAYFHPENGVIRLYDAFIRAMIDQLIEVAAKSSPSSQTPYLMKRWRDKILLNLAEVRRTQDAAQYTHFIDEKAASPAKDETRRRLKRFTEGLMALEKKGELNVPNTLRLLLPSNRPADAVALQLERGSSLRPSADYLGRSELRSDPSPDESQFWNTAMQVTIGSLLADPPVMLADEELPALGLAVRAIWEINPEEGGALGQQLIDRYEETVYQTPAFGEALAYAYPALPEYMKPWAIRRIISTAKENAQGYLGLARLFKENNIKGMNSETVLQVVQGMEEQIKKSARPLGFEEVRVLTQALALLATDTAISSEKRQAVRTFLKPYAGPLGFAILAPLYDPKEDASAVRDWLDRLERMDAETEDAFGIRLLGAIAQNDNSALQREILSRLSEMAQHSRSYAVRAGALEALADAHSKLSTDQKKSFFKSMQDFAEIKTPGIRSSFIYAALQFPPDSSGPLNLEGIDFPQKGFDEKFADEVLSAFTSPGAEDLDPFFLEVDGLESSGAEDPSAESQPDHSLREALADLADQEPAGGGAIWDRNEARRQKILDLIGLHEGLSKNKDFFTHAFYRRFYRPAASLFYHFGVVERATYTAKLRSKLMPLPGHWLTLLKSWLPPSWMYPELIPHLETLGAVHAKKIDASGDFRALIVEFAREGVPVPEAMTALGQILALEDTGAMLGLTDAPAASEILLQAAEAVLKKDRTQAAQAAQAALWALAGHQDRLNARQRVRFWRLMTQVKARLSTADYGVLESTAHILRPIPLRRMPENLLQSHRDRLMNLIFDEKAAVNPAIRDALVKLDGLKPLNDEKQFQQGLKSLLEEYPQTSNPEILKSLGHLYLWLDNSDKDALLDRIKTLLDLQDESVLMGAASEAFANLADAIDKHGIAILEDENEFGEEVPSPGAAEEAEPSLSVDSPEKIIEELAKKSRDSLLDGLMKKEALPGAHLRALGLTLRFWAKIDTKFAGPAASDMIEQYGDLQSPYAAEAMAYAYSALPPGDLIHSTSLKIAARANNDPKFYPALAALYIENPQSFNVDAIKLTISLTLKKMESKLQDHSSARLILSALAMMASRPDVPEDLRQDLRKRLQKEKPTHGYRLLAPLYAAGEDDGDIRTWLESLKKTDVEEQDDFAVRYLGIAARKAGDDLRGEIFETLAQLAESSTYPFLRGAALEALAEMFEVLSQDQRRVVAKVIEKQILSDTLVSPSPSAQFALQRISIYLQQTDFFKQPTGSPASAPKKPVAIPFGKPVSLNPDFPQVSKMFPSQDDELSQILQELIRRFDKEIQYSGYPKKADFFFYSQPAAALLPYFKRATQDKYLWELMQSVIPHTASWWTWVLSFFPRKLAYPAVIPHLETMAIAFNKAPSLGFTGSTSGFQDIILQYATEGVPEAMTALGHLLEHEGPPLTLGLPQTLSTASILLDAAKLYASRKGTMKPEQVRTAEAALWALVQNHDRLNQIQRELLDEIMLAAQSQMTADEFRFLKAAAFWNSPQPSAESQEQAAQYYAGALLEGMRQGMPLHRGAVKGFLRLIQSGDSSIQEMFEEAADSVFKDMKSGDGTAYAWFGLMYPWLKKSQKRHFMKKLESVFLLKGNIPFQAGALRSVANMMESLEAHKSWLKPSAAGDQQSEEKMSDDAESEWFASPESSLFSAVGLAGGKPATPQPPAFSIGPADEAFVEQFYDFAPAANGLQRVRMLSDSPSQAAQTSDAAVRLMEAYAEFERLNAEVLQLLYRPDQKVKDLTALFQALESMMLSYLVLFKGFPEGGRLAEAASHSENLQGGRALAVLYFKIKEVVESAVEELMPGADAEAFLHPSVQAMLKLLDETVSGRMIMNPAEALEAQNPASLTAFSLTQYRSYELDLQKGGQIQTARLNNWGITFHELIRIVHQKGRRNLFNVPGNLNVRQLSIVRQLAAADKFQNFRYNYVDARKNPDTLHPLPVRMVTYALAKRGQSSLFESTKAQILATESEAIVTLPLGLHSARVHFSLTPVQETGRVAVTYTDNEGYEPGSGIRIDAVERAFRTAGFQIRRAGKTLDALYDKDSGARSISDLEGRLDFAMTMLVSLLDLDLAVNRSATPDTLQEIRDRLAQGLSRDGNLRRSRSTVIDSEPRGLMDTRVRDLWQSLPATWQRQLRLPAGEAGQITLDEIYRLWGRALARGEVLGPADQGVPQLNPDFETLAAASPTEALLSAIFDEEDPRALSVDAERIAALSALVKPYAEHRIIGRVGRYRVERLTLPLIYEDVTLDILTDEQGKPHAGTAYLGSFFSNLRTVDRARRTIMPEGNRLNADSLGAFLRLYGFNQLQGVRNLPPSIDPKKSSVMGPIERIVYNEDFKQLLAEQPFVFEGLLAASVPDPQISPVSVGGMAAASGSVLAFARFKKEGRGANDFRNSIWIGEWADSTDDPQLAAAAGIVMTTGGLQSHAAVRSFEHRRPGAIINAAKVTDQGLSFEGYDSANRQLSIELRGSRVAYTEINPASKTNQIISDGDLVYLDARTGTLYLIAPSDDGAALKIFEEFLAWKQGVKSPNPTAERAEEIGRLAEILKKAEGSPLFSAILDEVIQENHLGANALPRFIEQLKTAGLMTQASARFATISGMQNKNYTLSESALRSLLEDPQGRSLEDVFLTTDKFLRASEAYGQALQLLPDETQTQDILARLQTDRDDRVRRVRELLQKRRKSLTASLERVLADSHESADRELGVLSAYHRAIMLSSLRDRAFLDGQSEDAALIQQLQERIEALTQQVKTQGQQMAGKPAVWKEEIPSRFLSDAVGGKAANSGELAAVLPDLEKRGLLPQGFEIRAPRGFDLPKGSYERWKESGQVTLEFKTAIETAYRELLIRQLETIYHRVQSAQGMEPQDREKLLKFLDPVTQGNLFSGFTHPLAVLLAIKTIRKSFNDFLSGSNAKTPRDLIELVGSFGAVAVRSSGLNEDGMNQSLAGMRESKLNVVGLDALYQAIEKVWRSGAEGVLIEEMIPGNVSGTAFSADTGQLDASVVRIESAHGLPKGLVDQSIKSPDVSIVRKPGGTARTYDILAPQNRVGDKAQKVVLDGDSEDGVRVVPNPEALQPSLTQDQARAVAQLVHGLEQTFGYPVEIEWTILGGTIYPLQVRPITTLNDAVERALQNLRSELRSDDGHDYRRIAIPPSRGSSTVHGRRNGNVYFRLTRGIPAGELEHFSAANLTFRLVEFPEPPGAARDGGARARGPAVGAASPRYALEVYLANEQGQGRWRRLEDIAIEDDRPIFIYRTTISGAESPGIYDLFVDTQDLVLAQTGQHKTLDREVIALSWKEDDGMVRTLYLPDMIQPGTQKQPVDMVSRSSADDPQSKERKTIDLDRAERHGLTEKSPLSDLLQYGMPGFKRPGHMTFMMTQRGATPIVILRSEGSTNGIRISRRLSPVSRAEPEGGEDFSEKMQQVQHSLVLQRPSEVEGQGGSLMFFYENFFRVNYRNGDSKNFWVENGKLYVMDTQKPDLDRSVLGNIFQFNEGPLAYTVAFKNNRITVTNNAANESDMLRVQPINLRSELRSQEVQELVQDIAQALSNKVRPAAMLGLAKRVVRAVIRWGSGPLLRALRLAGRAPAAGSATAEKALMDPSLSRAAQTWLSQSLRPLGNEKIGLFLDRPGDEIALSRVIHENPELKDRIEHLFLSKDMSEKLLAVSEIRHQKISQTPADYRPPPALSNAKSLPILTAAGRAAELSKNPHSFAAILGDISGDDALDQAEAAASIAASILASHNAVSAEALRKQPIERERVRNAVWKALLQGQEYEGPSFIEMDARGILSINRDAFRTFVTEFIARQAIEASA